MPAATAPGPDEPRTAAPGRDGGGPRGYTGTGAAGCGTPSPGGDAGLPEHGAVLRWGRGRRTGDPRGCRAGRSAVWGRVSPQQPSAQERPGGHPGRGQGVRPALGAAVPQMVSIG